MRVINAALAKVCELIWIREPKALHRFAEEDPATSGILLDNTVPNFKAIEAFQKLKAARPAARRVLISDHCDLGLIVQGLHTGAVQHIVYKPVHAGELLAALGMQNVAGSALPSANGQPARIAG